MKLLGVEDARARMLADAGRLGAERLSLDAADGRVLAEAVVADRDQPPFDGSAMDGWAVRSADLGEGETTLRIVGESAAGRGYAGAIGPGESVRIFTGAPLPVGADRVVIQERSRRDGSLVRLAAVQDDPAYVRGRGGDFRTGAALLAEGTRLDPWRLALAAAAGRFTLEVAVAPRVAILSTGEELVRPGSTPSPHAIFDSAGPALAALARRWGAAPMRLPPAPDSLSAVVEAVRDLDADLIVTIGGASVGDHDLVRPAFASLGLDLRVESVNVRPGKPTWFGRLPDGRRVLGLPGNPVSALVCAELFLRPLLLALQGADPTPRLRRARLAEALAPNGAREHWMRGVVSEHADGALVVSAAADQDSSLVATLNASGALIRRLGGAAATQPGEAVDVLLLERA